MNRTKHAETLHLHLDTETTRTTGSCSRTEDTARPGPARPVWKPDGWQATWGDRPVTGRWALLQQQEATPPAAINVTRES
jgi:hypothetical protein